MRHWYGCIPHTHHHNKPNVHGLPIPKPTPNLGKETRRGWWRQNKNPTIQTSNWPLLKGKREVGTLLERYLESNWIKVCSLNWCWEKEKGKSRVVVSWRLVKKVFKKLPQQQIIPHLLEEEYCRKKWGELSLVLIHQVGLMSSCHSCVSYTIQQSPNGIIHGRTWYPIPLPMNLMSLLIGWCMRFPKVTNKSTCACSIPKLVSIFH